MTTAVEIGWQRICERLRERIPDDSFDTWFGNTRPRALEGGRLELGVPSRFVKNSLVNQGGVALLAEIVGEITGETPEIELFVDGELFRKLRREAEAVMADLEADAAANAAADVDAKHAAARPAAPAHPPPATNPGYRFENFVTGNSPEAAFPVAAARLAVARPGDYPVLVLHGGTGGGKTHLLHAIAHAAHQADPSRRVMLTDARRFLQEYTAAHLARELERFRRRYSEIDLLAIDDFHVLAEGQKTATAAEFLNLFDRLTQSGRGQQIVLATHTPPAELDSLPENLKNRLQAALAVRLVFPDDGDGIEAGIRLVREKARARGLAVPREAARVLVEASPPNARALEGAVGRLCALAAFGGGEANVETARLAVRDIAAPPSGGERVLTVADVAGAVAEAMRLRIDELRGRGRTRTVRVGRQLTVALARRLTGASLAEIGGYLGGRTHATILSIQRSLGGGWWRDGLLSRPASRALSALGRREPLSSLFPEQGLLFPDEPETEGTATEMRN